MILLTGRINVLQNAIVHSVQVLHIEGGEGQRFVELLGEETHPCIIPHKNNSLAFKPGEKTQQLTNALAEKLYFMIISILTLRFI